VSPTTTSLNRCDALTILPDDSISAAAWTETDNPLVSAASLLATFTEIASDFCTSGSPGIIFGPAGLTYDPSNETLYVVNKSSASVLTLVGARTAWS